MKELEKLNFGAIFRAKNGAKGEGRGSRNPKLDETSFMDVPLHESSASMTIKKNKIPQAVWELQTR